MPSLDKSEYSFNVERLRDVILSGEAKDLFSANQKETGWNKDLEIDPVYEAFYKLEDKRALKFFTIRMSGDKLIGYALFIIGTDLRVKSKKRADQQMVYVDPEHRGIGVSFMRYQDHALKEDGVDIVWRQMKPHKSNFKAFQKMGYTFQEYVFSKEF